MDSVCMLLFAALSYWDLITGVEGGGGRWGYGIGCRVQPGDSLLESGDLCCA